MTPRIRSRIALLPLALAASLAAAQTSAGSPFDENERRGVMAYWASPGRYLSDAPDDVAKVGVWQVRLTVVGSQWLWNLTRGKKVPPTQVAQAQPAWEAWIAAKLLHDRWEALRTARAANLEAIGKELPRPDATTPLVEPTIPGPMPADLLAALGPAPKLAEAVAPLAHRIVFDDLALAYEDNVRMSPRYAYYRFASGVRSGGAPVKAMAKSDLDRLFRLAGVDDSAARVMRGVSILEGGFDSVNTYDTGFVSVGFIQFAALKEGGHSLGQVLKSFKATDPLGFAADFHRFGVDVTDAGLLAVVDPTGGGLAIGPDANARIIEDKRLIAVFQRAGLKSEGFRAAQVRMAKAIYWPADDRVNVLLGGFPTLVRVGDLVASEAGLATLFDRKVNTGHIDALGDAATRVAIAQNLTSVADLAKYEKTLVALVRYRKEYLGDAALSQPPEPPVAVPLAALRRRPAANRRTATTPASRSGGTAPGAPRGHRAKLKKNVGA